MCHTQQNSAASWKSAKRATNYLWDYRFPASPADSMLQPIFDKPIYRPEHVFCFLLPNLRHKSGQTAIRAVVIFRQKSSNFSKIVTFPVEHGSHQTKIHLFHSDESRAQLQKVTNTHCPHFELPKNELELKYQILIRNSQKNIPQIQTGLFTSL